MTEGNHMELPAPCLERAYGFFTIQLQLQASAKAMQIAGIMPLVWGLAGIRKAREETECLEVHGE
jgi:hypothetical protein